MADEQQPAAEIPPGPSEREQAEILARPTPGQIVAWRKQYMPERSLYKDSEFKGVVPDDNFAGADLPEAKRLAAASNLRSMFADLGVSPAEAQQLLNRSSAVRADNQTAEQQRREARAELTRQFGKNADVMLRDAKGLVARDSRMVAFIEKRGIGNDPETIVMLARAAHSHKMAGRLR